MRNHLSWVNIGLLNEKSTDFSNYSKDIGVYRATLNGRLVYIGKATELHNGGFRKRLRDYTRASSSARNYPAGQLMNKNKDEIIIEIAIFERSESSISRIEELESKLIKEMKPIWNLIA